MGFGGALTHPPTRCPPPIPGIVRLNWWSQKQDQLVGPFVRKNDGNKYIIDELYGHKYYSMMLPRVMMLGKAHLKVYRTIKQEIRDYVDSQVAHCDDITMNVAVVRWPLLAVHAFGEGGGRPPRCFFFSFSFLFFGISLYPALRGYGGSRWFREDR